MKVFVFLSVIALTLACCKSRERMMYPSGGYVTTQPVEPEVRETVRDTIVVKEEPEVSRTERVIRTAGAEPKRYCIIVGSFMYPENARRLHNEVIRMGFYGSTVMRNSEGMYRVCVVCDEEEAEAQAELSRIRSRYPGFRDAWILTVER